MILSKYNVYLEDYPFDSGVTIFNLVNKELYFLENKYQLQGYDFLDIYTKQYLYSHHFCFLNDVEEDEYIAKFMQEKYQTDDHLDITVVTSQNCNLQCVYCFEGASHAKNMSKDVYDQLISEIDKEMGEKGYNSLYIHYYGGEPLMNYRLIAEMNAYLSEKYKDKYTFGLVSNGVLLTKEMVNTWINQGFRRIKITLDGEKKINDCRRVAKDGLSTYDRVMHNLSFLPNDTDNVLHLVVDQTNVNHIEGMLREMYERGYQNKICICISYTHPHFDVSAKLRASTVLKVAKLAKKFGFTQSYLIGVDGEGICPNKDNHSYLVDIDGTKYKCTGFMGYKNSAAGLYHGVEDKFINTDKECRACKYLPVCNGGCQYVKELRNGIKYCQKEYFDLLIPSLLKEVYLDYELSD